jgi:hypothetical protein
MAAAAHKGTGNMWAGRATLDSEFNALTDSKIVLRFTANMG